MHQPVIVDAVRTPIGRRNGSLAHVHPVDLSAHVLNSLIARNGLEPEAIEDVIWGCVNQIADQSANVGRWAVLAAGWPETIPGTTIDRACGSSQQAVQFAFASVAAGHYDVVIAGGVESMSRVPLGAARATGEPYGPAVRTRYQRDSFSQGLGAEEIARRWGISRSRLDEFSLRSHQLSIAATAAGAFDDQLVPYPAGEATLRHDEGVRPDTSLQKLGGLRSAFTEDGVVTAGNSSQISDGSAALLIMSNEAARDLGRKPLARYHCGAVVGADPVMMLTAPIPATQRVLKRAGTRDRRHRCLRGQRGVRLGSAGVAGRDQRRLRPPQSTRRRHRRRAPARSIGRNPDDQTRSPPPRQRYALRPADDVRGRRHGQRHDHRVRFLARHIRRTRAPHVAPETKEVR